MSSADIAPNAYQIAQTLKDKYKDFNHHNKRNPLDELLFIICSAKTDEKKYLSTFRYLKKAFPRFDMLLNAPVEQIAKAIAAGGLSNQKAAAIKDILSEIASRFGKPTLAPLRQMSDRECEAFLTSVPRIGKKTARCVMMYSLDRDVFPVDTHCWRISQRLGWVASTYSDGRCVQKDMDRLQDVIPPELRYTLHVNMVSLGREICTVRNPKCDICLISQWCPKIGVSESSIEK